jgi:alpha-mannosidase
MPHFVFHILPNAHLDPVWLWDWREGLNEGVTTVSTVLDLMDEFPELTFIRGESVIYQHIQKTAPRLFDRILRKIETGRWDVVGGTVIQPDTNLISTEVLCRQFEQGLRYFQKTFGLRPKIAWQADSFGHSAGLPNVFSDFGIEGFAFTRPQRGQFPLEEAAFWWEGDWGNKVLCYRQHWPWYCNGRTNVPRVLNMTLEGASKHDLTNVGVLVGLGNHGGGPTRKHLQEIETWSRQHPEVRVQYSTMHRLFEVLREEITLKTSTPIPTVRGDLGFCLRGCYSSVQKFKRLYRDAETLVVAAEQANALICAMQKNPGESLSEAWDALLFNAFHDILPGSSIERTYDEQMAWVGGAIHRAQCVQFSALNLLAAEVDMTVPAARRKDLPRDVPVLLWNHLPRVFRGLVEIETSLDYRPIDEFKDRPSLLPVVVYNSRKKLIPHQVIETEHSSMPNVPWRRRVLVPVEIPAWGWTVVRMGWRDRASKRSYGVCSVRKAPRPLLTYGSWKLRVMDDHLEFSHLGKNVFGKNRGPELVVVEDPWGSWGGMVEEIDSFCLEKITEKWSLKKHYILEEGPLRAKLWTRWEGKNSWVELTFTLENNLPMVECEARLLWNERSARLKLVLPCRGELEYDVPAGKVYRQVQGQVPGGRWVTRKNKETLVGFASDVLGDFDAPHDELRVTLARATRYANDVVTGPHEQPWRPAVDCGELKCRFALFGEDMLPDHAADLLLHQPTSLIASPTGGTLPREGSIGGLSSLFCRVLSVQMDGPDTLQVRIQNRHHQSESVRLDLQGDSIELGTLRPQQISTYLLKRHRGRFACIQENRGVRNGSTSRESSGSVR